jgi:hypothetical protein
MSRDVKSYTLFDAAAPRAIASSTNASPIEVTMAAPHGYTTGDKVTISGHLVNTNANGSWTATVTGTTTLELDGSVGNGIGGATGTLTPRSKIILCSDFRDAVLAFNSDGGGDAAMTIQVVGSIQKAVPDFALPQSPSNQYDFIQIVDMEDSSTLDGDVGVVLAAADVNRMFEVNVNGLQWLALLIPTGTAGEITVAARIFNNN